MPHGAAVGVAFIFFFFYAYCGKKVAKKAGETETETVARATPLERQLNVVAFVILCFTFLFHFIF